MGQSGDNARNPAAHNPATHHRADHEAEQRDQIVDKRDAGHPGEREPDEQHVAGHVAREHMVQGEITIGVNHARRRCEQEQARGVPVVYR